MKEVYYIICSYPSSGNHLLRHLLMSLGMGTPYGIKDGILPGQSTVKLDFSDPWRSARFLLDKKAIKFKHNFLMGDSSLLPVYSRLVWWRQMREILLALRRFSGVDESIPDSELLEHLYPGIKYIHLYRRDKLHQAISAHRAHQTKSWIRRRNTDLSRYRKNTYDFESIVSFLRGCLKSDMQWNSLFEEMGIAPLRVCCEDMVIDKVGTFRKIASFLGVSVEHQNKITSDRIEEALLLSEAPIPQDKEIDKWCVRFWNEIIPILSCIRKDVSK